MFHVLIAQRSMELGTISHGKGDVLRPAQVASYATLEPPAWLTLDLCKRVCEGGAAVLTDAQRKELNTLMQDLPKSHIWAKGFCAAQLLADNAL